MIDLATYTPSPELLAARERFLQACIDAPFWNPPHRKPNFNSKPAFRAKQADVKPVSFHDDLRDVLGAIIERCVSRVRETRAAEREMIDARTTMPNNYWVPRRRAEQQLAAAIAVLDAVLES
jgi:hypothetical protein